MTKRPLGLALSCALACTTGPEPSLDDASLPRASAQERMPAVAKLWDRSRTGEREYMVDAQIAARGVKDRRVREGMRMVPRHEFVGETERAFAYEDYPLPIGYDQTISQPYVVALMTELLGPKAEHRVL